MGKIITLENVLQYYEMDSDPVDRIQIVTNNQNWENAGELYVDSELLNPFRSFTVTDMRCEESRFDRKPVLRVLIGGKSQTKGSDTENEMLGNQLRLDPGNFG